MPDLGAALDRQLLDATGVMKEPVSSEALHLDEAIGRNLIIEVIVSREGVDRVTRVSETFRLRVDSVRDTVTDSWLTLDDAVDASIIIAAHGEYVDRRRGIDMPLIDAVRDGLVQGRLLDVERKKEEVTRTAKEPSLRPVATSGDDLPQSINVRGIFDPQTGLELSVTEAIDAGIFDPSTGEYIDRRTGERLSLERAIADGLVLADRGDMADEVVVQQTYSIGAVYDPVTSEWISPREAVSRGLLDMARGVFIHPTTQEVMTLAEALERGLIRADGDSATAPKVEHGRMVFTIRRVKDLSTGEMVGPDEAESRGILDTARGLYIDRRNGTTMLLYEAYEAGLIEAAETQPAAVSPTAFNIVAVIDPRNGEELTVAEAIDRHLLDAALRQFIDLRNYEVMSVEEAVRRGHIITDDDSKAPGPAAVTHDAQSYRIKSVIDPQTGEEIPISDAVRHKIVDKGSGMYWNMKTNEMIPIDEAIRLGLVITEPVDAAVTKTAQLDIGDDFEKQMYLLTSVRDPRTGKEFDPVEAERRGLINKLQGVYINAVTGEKIPIREAIERNLISGSLVAEADYDDLPPGAYSIETRPVKTSDVTGVWDPVSRRQVSTSSCESFFMLSVQVVFVGFYRAMHFSAKRGIAIACHLSVRPSVCPSVTLLNCDHIGWNSSKLISSLVSLGRSLFATPT